MKVILAIAGFVLGVGATLGVLSVLSTKGDDVCGDLPIQGFDGTSESEE